MTWQTQLRCEPCDKHKCDDCLRWVKAFVEPSGPDTYACECYCNQRRREKETVDRKVKELLTAYLRRYTADQLREVVSGVLPPSEVAPIGPN